MHTECTDEELLYMIRSNSEEALMILLERICEALLTTIEKIIKRLGCYDVDDAKQVVRLGCLSAIDTFRGDKDSSFRYFAKMCAEREVRSMLRKERIKGLASHYMSISLDQIREEEGTYLVDLIENTHEEYNPVWYVKRRQMESDYTEFVKYLTKLEKSICDLRMQGYTYKEIAKILNLNVKCIDNTMQRIRRKLHRMFD